MTDARQIRIQWAALAVVSCICLITAGQGCNELDDFPNQPDFDLYLNQPLKAPSKDCQHTGRVIWAIICGGLSTILSLAFLVAAPKLSQNANKAIGLFFLSWWTAGVGVLAFMNDRVAQPGWGVLSNGFASIWLAYLFSVRLNLLLWVSPSDAVSPPSSTALGASRDSFAILFATSAALLVQLSKDCDMKLGGKCTAEFGYALAVPVVSFFFCLVTLVANHKGDAQSVTAVRCLSAFFFTWWALAFGILTLKDNATGVTVIRVYPQNVGVAWFSLWGAFLSSTFLVAGVFIAEDTKKQPAGKDAAPPAADEAPDATQSATPQVESYAA